MHVDSLNKLVNKELQDVYDAEHQILEALPKMIKAAQSKELSKALDEHLTATKRQKERLELVFEALGTKPQRKHCHGMAGLIKEGSEVLEEDMDPEVRDVALIAAAQRVEHYEIAAYGALRTFAKLLGNMEVAKLLQQTLEEEAYADRTLTAIAEYQVNLKAAGVEVEA
jgi:ferritin-like metal-binding protein YciE